MRWSVGKTSHQQNNRSGSFLCPLIYLASGSWPHEQYQIQVSFQVTSLKSNKKVISIILMPPLQRWTYNTGRLLLQQMKFSPPEVCRAPSSSMNAGQQGLSSQASTSQMSPCSMTQLCGVFSSSVLMSIAVAIAYNLGSSIVPNNSKRCYPFLVLGFLFGSICLVGVLVSIIQHAPSMGMPGRWLNGI